MITFRQWVLERARFNYPLREGDTTSSVAGKHALRDSLGEAPDLDFTSEPGLRTWFQFKFGDPPPTGSKYDRARVLWGEYQACLRRARRSPR